MDGLGAWWRRALFLFRRARFTRELEEEMRHHLDLKAAAHLREGMASDEALHAARREFGNVLHLRDRSREAWGWLSAEAILRDFRYGCRQLRR
jgi:hypothetical protein